MNKTINYIGTLPPPYGGVTIRNVEFQKALSNHYNIKKFDTAKLKKPLDYLKLLSFIFKHRNNRGIISISTPSFLKLTRLLSRFNKLLNNYIVITTGGTVDKQFERCNIPISVLNSYKAYFTETNKLKSDITKLGVKDVEFLPNCRLKPQNRVFNNREINKVRFISISRISYEKGIDTILEVDDIIPKDKDYIIDFYGPVDKDIHDIFMNAINKSEKMFYKGVFEGDKYDINDLLIEYDVLLFPTRHLAEGHPGVLTNAKIAGCTIIATDLNANAEIVKPGNDGIIISKSDSGLLMNAMMQLIENKDLLGKLKRESFNSANNYFIENHLYKINDRLDNWL